MTFRAPVGTRVQPIDATAAVNSQSPSNRAPLTGIAPPFLPADFPNPRAGPFALQPTVIRPQYVAPPPFSQSDYPNPRGPQPPPQDFWSQTPPGRIISLSPFTPVDFPNPRAPAPLPQDFWSQPAPARQIGLNPFKPIDAPNPRSPGPLLQDYQSRGSVIAQPGPTPHSQSDYPNPRGSQPSLQDFQSRPSPVLQLGLSPFVQRDWQNPRGPGQPTFDFVLPNTQGIQPVVTTIVVERGPLIQAIWRVDSTAAVNAQFTGTRLPLLVPPGIPFRPIDYPNPRGPGPLLQDIQNAPATAQQITLKPFFQADYPNPRGPAPLPFDIWLSIPATLLPSFAPFYQTNYPNPRGPAPLLQEIGPPNTVVPLLPAITILRGPYVFRSWRVDSTVAVNAQSWLSRPSNPSAPVVRTAVGTAFGAGTAIAIGSALSSPFFNEYAAYVYQFPNTAIRFASYDPVSRLLWVQFLSGLSVVVPNVSVGTASSIQSAANGEAFVLALARSVNPLAG